MPVTDRHLYFRPSPGTYALAPERDCERFCLFLQANHFPAALLPAINDLFNHQNPCKLWSILKDLFYPTD